MIQINNDWRIDTDAYNIILQQRKVANKGDNPSGKERWDNIGYYGTFQQALCVLVEQDVKASSDFQEAVSRIESLKAEIMGLPIVEK